MEEHPFDDLSNPESFSISKFIAVCMEVINGTLILIAIRWMYLEIEIHL